MITYEIKTKRFGFADKTFEDSLGQSGLEIKSVRTDNENLIYKVERERDLTIGEKVGIMRIDGVSSVVTVE